MRTLNPKTNKSNQSHGKATGWLVEAIFRLSVGYLMLLHFHQYRFIAIVIGLYALLTGALIVVITFMNAHKN